MSSLITKKEEKALRRLLALAPLPEVTLTFNELRGYIYGLAITPDQIEPGEWLAVVFGGQMPAFAGEAQARELTATIFTVLNKHIAAFESDSLFMPFNMEMLHEESFEEIFEWTSGFEEALSLRPQFWDEYDGLSGEGQEHLMNSLLIVEGIVYPEEAVEMFDHLPRRELLNIGIDLSRGEAERLAQIQFFMLQALELSVETIQEHAARLDRKRKEELRRSPAPFRLRSSSVGQNSACPCGSGRTYRKCCAPAPGSGASNRDGGGKRGKVIAVDFSGKGKKKNTQGQPPVGRAASRRRQKDALLPGYQLEISLSSTKAAIWRRVEVPGAMTLAELHALIQLVMGWQDSHLHRFQAGNRFFGPQLADDYLAGAVLDESRFTVHDLHEDFLRGVVYTYDFGDNWEHVVALEKVIPSAESGNRPRLLAGARACPPEDIGGMAMYDEFLDFLAGQGSVELGRHFDQPALRDYDPEAVDIAAINDLLLERYGGR